MELKPNVSSAEHASINCQAESAWRPAFFSRVLLEGRDSAYLVFKIDPDRRVASLMPVKAGLSLEMDVPFAKLKPLNDDHPRSSYAPAAPGARHGDPIERGNELVNWTAIQDTAEALRVGCTKSCDLNHNVGSYPGQKWP